MNSNLILYPMVAHILWVALLYVLLTLVRAPAVWGFIQSKKESWAEVEPRISANLSNQFEWPLFFYVVCVLLMSRGSVIEPVQVWLAWVFFIGRFIHSFVQILTNNIRLRGLIFTINYFGCNSHVGFLRILIFVMKPPVKLALFPYCCC